MDKPALKPLLATAYQYAQWKKAKVHIDYHVEVDRHYYAVARLWSLPRPGHLAKKHGEARVEAACLRALAHGAFSSKSIERIIDKELDKAPWLTPAPESNPILHPNIRRAGYFLAAQGISHAD